MYVLNVSFNVETRQSVYYWRIQYDILSVDKERVIKYPILRKLWIDVLLNLKLILINRLVFKVL